MRIVQVLRAALIALSSAISADAATLTLSIRHSESGSSSIFVLPGATTVNYEIVGALSGGSDNDGLALWGTDVTFGGTHGSIANQNGSLVNPGGVMTAFDYPNGVTNPPFPPGSYGGTNNGVCLLQVGGGQNTIGNTAANAPFPIGTVVKDVAVTSQVLARGTYLVPPSSPPGSTHVIAPANCFANVIDEGEEGPVIYGVSSATVDCSNFPLTITVTCGGVPVPGLTGVVSRKNCDITIRSANRTSEPRAGGITNLIFYFDIGPSGGSISLEEDRTCPGPPSYGPYTGSSQISCVPGNGNLNCTLTPGLENARSYRIKVVGGDACGTSTTYVELRGLIGDVDSNGRVNATDRSAVVGAWTGPGAYSCQTDIDSSGTTNAIDRSIVVGSWTSSAINCAP